VVLVAWLALPAAGAFAYDISAFGGATRVATVKDYTPKVDNEENRRNKFYWEQWTFNFEPKDGHDLKIQVLVSNMAVGNGKAAVRVDFEPAGKKAIETAVMLDREQWSYVAEGEKLVMTLGKNVFSGDGKTWQGHFANDQFEIDVAIKNTVPAHVVGGGATYYGKGERFYYRSVILTPRGSFEADVKMNAGGETFHLSGGVFGDNSAANLAPNLQARSWIRMRTNGATHTLSVTAFKTSEEYGGQWVGTFFLATEGRFLGWAGKPTVELADLDLDPANNYQIPRIILFDGVGGGASFTGAIKATKMTARRARLDTLGAVERAIVSKFVQPVTYSYDASFEFRFKRGEEQLALTGKGRYGFEQVSQPESAP
jgi:hypothetical protein